jgi:hypothetical protein
MRWVGLAARICRENEKWVQKFNLKILRKRTLGRSRRTWDDIIKVNSEEIEFEGVDWIYLAQDRVQWRALVNTRMNLRSSIKDGKLLDQVNDC